MRYFKSLGRFLDPDGTKMRVMLVEGGYVLENWHEGGWQPLLKAETLAELKENSQSWFNISIPDRIQPPRG